MLVAPTEDAIEDAAVLINATGAAELDWPLDTFAGSLAIEFQYVPKQTAFLDRATARGAKKIDGVDLFAAQARRQSELLYDVDVSPEQARTWVEEAYAELLEDESAGEGSR